MKLVLFADGSKYTVDPCTDFNCTHGTVPRDILQKTGAQEYTTQKGVRCLITEPHFIDKFEKFIKFVWLSRRGCGKN